MRRSTAVESDPVIQRFIQRLLPRLRDEWRAKHVILFGSRVRGEADEWSDLDAIVVSDAFDGQRFIDRIPTLFRSLGCPVELEPLCYTPEEFERKRQEPGVVATACKEGIWLLQETGDRVASPLRVGADPSGLSARAYDCTPRAARAIADLEGGEDLLVDHVAEAVEYRSLDRKLWV